MIKTDILKISLILAIIINFFLTLSLIPIFNIDEGVFCEATREMFYNHNYITPFLEGEYRFDKPILIYWLQLISIKIFGINEFAFRLPSALAATFWAFGIYWFAKKIYSEKIGLIAAFLMVTSLQISIIAKAAMADSLLNMFIAFSMFSVYLYLKEKKEKYLLLAFAFIGFGTLTKGPVAIMIPLIVTFIFMLIKKEFKEFLKMIFNVKGIVIFLIITLPWFIAVDIQTHGEFLKVFILQHNLNRFSHPLEHHGGNYLYYIPIILIGLIPWTSLFIAYLIKLKTLIKNDFILFGSIWFFFVFLFFSFSHTKLPHYIIYGYTPLFIFMALMTGKIKEIYLSIPLILFILTLLILPFILHYKDVILFNILKPYFNYIYYGSFLLLLIISLLKLKGYKFLFLGFAAIFTVNYAIWIYAHARALPIKEAAFFAKKHNIKNIYLPQNLPSFSVYFNKITPRKKPKKGEMALIKIKKAKNYKIIYKKGLIALGVKK